MGFTIHTTDDGRALPWEYLPAGVITPKIGLALTLSAGTLTKASGKPDYICMTQADAAVASGTIIPVVKVQPDVIWETTLSAAGASLKQGNAVTLASDGLRVTATTDNGVFTLTEIVDPASGGIVRGRFL